MKPQRLQPNKDKIGSNSAKLKPNQINLAQKFEEDKSIVVQNYDQNEIAINVKNNIILISLIFIIYCVIELICMQIQHGIDVKPEIIQKAIRVLFFIGQNLIVYKGDFQTSLQHFRPFYYCQILSVFIFASYAQNQDDPVFLWHKALWTIITTLNITFYQYVNQSQGPLQLMLIVIYLTVCKHYDMGMDYSQQVCMMVCLFFPFENLDLELVTTEDDYSISGYRNSVINIMMKYKKNATKAINNILNQQTEPAFKAQKYQKLYNALRQQSQKIMKTDMDSLNMEEHLIVKKQFIKEIISAKSISINSSDSNDEELKNAQKQKSQAPSSTKRKKKVSKGKKISETLLNSVLDEIEEDLDEDVSVSLSNTSQSKQSDENSIHVDKFDEISIVCTPPTNITDEIGKRNYMNNAFDDFNKKNDSIRIKLSIEEQIDKEKDKEEQKEEQKQANKLLQNFRKNSYINQTNKKIQVQNKFSFGSDIYTIQELTSGIQTRNESESLDTDSNKDKKHKTFKIGQDFTPEDSIPIKKCLTGSFKIENQKKKTLNIPCLQIAQKDSMQSFVNSPLPKDRDENSPKNPNFAITVKQVDDDNDNTSEIFYQQFQSQGGLSDVILESENEDSYDNSSSITSQSLSDFDDNSTPKNNELDPKAQLNKKIQMRRRNQDALSVMIQDGKEIILKSPKKQETNQTFLESPQFQSMFTKKDSSPIEVKKFLSYENTAKSKNVKTYMELPQVQLNQKKKISTNNIQNQRYQAQGQTVNISPLLRSKTLKFDKMDEEIEFQDQQNKFIMKSQYTINLRNQQIQYFRQKANDQENCLENTKSFLNMIIHELRSPANQIKYKVVEAIEELKLIRQKQEQSLKESDKLNRMIEEMIQEQKSNQNFSNSPRFGSYQDSSQKNRQSRQLEVIMEDENIEQSPDMIQQNNKVFDISFNNKNGFQSNNIMKKKSSSSDSPNDSSKKIKERSYFGIKQENSYINSMEDSIMSGDNSGEQIIQVENIESKISSSPSKIEQEYKNDENNRKMTDKIYKISNELSQIDNLKSKFYNNLPDYQKNSRQKSLKTLLEGYSKQYVKEQQEFQITENDNEPNFDFRTKKLSQNLDLVYQSVNSDSRKLNMSTQTTINQDMFYFNQNSMKQQKNQLILHQKQLCDQIQSYGKQKEQVEKVIENLFRCDYCSKMLLNHINDLLDFAKLEKNKFQFFNEFFDMTQTIKNTIQDVEYMSKGKNIQPQFVIDQNVELFFKNIYGDEARYTQIFLNFLSNAFKFTPENGKISIEIRPYGEQFSQQIKDESQIQEIIGKYGNDQFDSKASVKQKLQISNNLQGSLKNLMDSGIEIQGDALYYVAFQLIIKDSGRGISKDDQEKLFIKFNMVGNSSDGNKQGTGLGLSICKHFITKMGGDVKVQSDGIGHGTSFVINLRAISKLSEIKRKEHLQLLHVDEIANNNLFKEQEIQSQLQQKYQSTLKKMVKSELDVSKYSKFVSEQPQDLSDKSQCGDQQDEKQKVQKMIEDLKALVINDELFILESLQEIVKEVGIQDVDRAINGLDAQIKIQKKHYDFIICDINMPVMNGYDFADKLFDQYKGKSLFNASDERHCPYLVACTSESSKQAIQKCKKHGFEKIISFLTLQILEDEILKEVFKLKHNHKINSSMPQVALPSKNSLEEHKEQSASELSKSQPLAYI